MAREIIPHQITDWSRIDERDSFWGRIDLLRSEENFGIHRYNNDLWTSGQIGVGRVFDRDGMPIHDNGKEHVLLVSSNYGMDPWMMLETVMLDDEYDNYIEELSAEKKTLFTIHYDQPLIPLPQGSVFEAETLFALSFVNACYSLCKKGLKKSLVSHEENFTAKLRGKIDVGKNIKHNTTRGRSDKFYCKYIDFTEDTIENRIVKAALFKCRNILREQFQEETSIRSKISYCTNTLRRVKKTTISNTDFNTSTVGGLYSYYKPVIQQARAILTMDEQKRSDDIEGTPRKAVHTIPYAINMETLFEYYARTELKKALKGSEYSVEKYSRKIYLQEGIDASEDAEKGIHLMPFCIPDIIICDGADPVFVIDAKYKVSGRPDRSDTHQLLSYVLLTGATKCGFILPGEKTEVKEMITSKDNYLPLTPEGLRYYEMHLGNKTDAKELKKALI